MTRGTQVSVKMNIFVTIFISKYKTWRQQYHLSLSLQQENNNWRIRTTVNVSSGIEQHFLCVTVCY